MTAGGSLTIKLYPDSGAVADALDIIAKHAAACAAELRGDITTSKQYGTAQSDPEAARAFLDSIGPAEPVEPRFIVAPDGETTDCCSESHSPTFNVSVFNPAPERAIDFINQRFDGITS